MPDNDSAPKNSRRRAERAEVGSRFRGVYLKCPCLSAGPIPVSNISEVGLGFENSEVRVPVEPGSSFDAAVLIGHSCISVQIRIVRVAGSCVGVEIVNPSNMFRLAIQRYLETELSASSLVEQGREPWNECPEGEICIYSSSGAGFKIYLEAENIRKFEIKVLGNFIEWSEGGEIQMRQNEILVPISDFFCKELLKFIRNAAVIGADRQHYIEAILLRLKN